MVAQHIAFGIIAAIVIVGALRVVTTNNVVHAALWLVAVLAGVGGSFLLLGAEFVGVTQLLIYIGAIVVLFLFGIMLTRAPIGREVNLTARTWPMGLVVAIPIAGVLAYTLIDASVQITSATTLGSSPRQVSDTLFQNYLIPFEVVSVLLLAALIGAIVLARKDDPVLLNEFLLLGAALFAIGVYGVLARRNGVMVLMSIELILNAVNINLIAFGALHHTVVGQVFALFVITIAAAEVGVGLAIVLMLYRNRASIDLDQVDAMRG